MQSSPWVWWWCVPQPCLLLLSKGKLGDDLLQQGRARECLWPWGETVVLWVCPRVCENEDCFTWVHVYTTEIMCGGYLRKLSVCWRPFWLGVYLDEGFFPRSRFHCLTRVQFPTRRHWLGASLKQFYISTAPLPLTKPFQHQTDINHQWMRPWGASVNARV